VTRRRVFVDAKAPFPRDKAVTSEDVMLVPSELDNHITDSWIYYKTWEYKVGRLSGLSVPKNVDVLLVHGESRSTIALRLTKQLMHLPLSSFRLSRVHVGCQSVSRTW
jgi:hypothetical protein